MSQTFQNVQVGKLADAAFAQTQADMAKYTQEYQHVEKGKTLETQLGTLKLTMGGKKLAEAFGNRLKPVLKQKLGKGWEQFKNKWNEKSNNNLRNSLREKADTNEAARARQMARAENNVDETEATADEAEKAAAFAKIDHDALPEQHALNEEARQVDEEEAQDNIDNAGQEALDAGKTAEEAEEATSAAVRNAVQVQATNDAARAAEPAEMEASEANLSGLTDDAEAAASAHVDALAAKETLEGTHAAAATAESEEISAVPEVVTAAEVGTDVGTGVMEAVGQALDDTGILAPLGLLLGAGGIALGESKKHDPSLPTNMAQNEHNYSFQTGVGM